MQAIQLSTVASKQLLLETKGQIARLQQHLVRSTSLLLRSSQSSFLLADTVDSPKLPQTVRADLLPFSTYPPHSTRLVESTVAVEWPQINLLLGRKISTLE
jgi:hypothetical protein